MYFLELLIQLIIWYLYLRYIYQVFLCYETTGRKVYALENLLIQTYVITLPVLLGYIVWMLKQQKWDRDANSQGTMLLLKVQLIEYHDKYVKLEYIPSYVFDNYCEMYEAYHELGGNGMITRMFEEIKQLPIRKGNEYEE